jgi:aspartate aminotransferase-like enzyme
MQNLRIPGPTPCPDEILYGSAKPMINHRGSEFRDILSSVTEGLKKVFMTTNDLYILTASGTGAMEAAIVNSLSPGDKVLSITIGVFGNRFGQIASAYGAHVTTLSVPMGMGADIEQIQQILRKKQDFKAVMVTHNETSTGVTNDLEAISKVVKEESNALLLIDAISSIGCIPLPVDNWGCDVVVTGSQKGFMIPPGLAFISFSERAWDANKKAQMPRFYFDIGKAKAYYENGETPWTPAVSIFYGLQLALDKMLKEGMQNIYDNHRKLGKLTRQGIKTLGLDLFADEQFASNTITAGSIPPDLDGKKLVSFMQADHNVIIAGGQQELSGKIFRIGHLGYCSEDDINGALSALASTLNKMQFVPTNS